MLDNKNINEQFANEGWARMRQILDTEMPVAQENRKRPVAWFWWRTAGIAAVAIIGLLGLWRAISDTSFSHVNDVAEATQQQPIAPESADIAQAQSAETPTQNVPSEQAQVLAPSQASTAPLTASSTKKQTVAHTPAPMQVVQDAVANTQQNSTAAIVEEGVTTIAQNDQHANSEAPQVQEGIETDALQTTQSTPLESLILRNPNAVATQNTVANNLPVSPKVMPKISTWRTGLEAGAIAGFPAQLEGFSAGWVIEAPISKSLALRSGLRYSFHRQTVSKSDQRFDSQQDAIESSMLTDPFVFNEQNFVGASVDSMSGSSILKLHYLNLPITASFRMSNRLRIEGGVKVSRLLNAFRQKNYGSGGIADFDPMTNNLDLARSSWYFSTKAQQVGQENFRRWDVTLSAGLRYQLSRHWDMSFYGNYGLLNQADKANRYRIFNKNATLGVGYYF